MSSRREFLKRTLAGSATAALPAISPAKSAGEIGKFLTGAEMAFVRAWVDHMIPADVLSPKGTDLDVHEYIDGALDGPWGKGAGMYLDGPWKRGTTSQGYQLPYNRAQFIRAGIEATDAYCGKTYGKPFAALTAARREELLRGLDQFEVKFEDNLPAKGFFELMLRLVMEGMFADPAHGGNRGKAGWKLVGFPGAGGRYRESLRKFRDKPYRAEPKGVKEG